MCPRPRPHRGRASFANGQNFREVGLHQCPSERKGEGVPVRRLRVPSHVPSHPQTAAKVRGFSPIASGFTGETDWLLEEAVTSELVSEAKFPARWENTGNFIELGLGDALTVAKNVIQSVPYGPIPYAS